MYTDLGFCVEELQCFADNWKEVANYYCKQNGCSLSDQELKAKNDYQLLQTMLAIYNWMDTPVKLMGDELIMKHLSQLNQDEIKSSQNHLEDEDSKSKTHRVDSNIDTINKWRQVIDEFSEED